MPLYHPVTGLPIKALFHDRLTQAVALAARRKRHFAIVQLAIHGAEDLDNQPELLQELIKRLVLQLRESDTVSRLDNSDFSILLNDIDSRAAANAVAEELVLALQRPLAIDGAPETISASHGLALFPDDGDTETAILRAAEDSLQEAQQRQLADA